MKHTTNQLIYICIALFFVRYTASLEGHASIHTKKSNENVLQQLPFNNKQDFHDAMRGFIAPLANDGVIKNKKGQPVWSVADYNFLKQSQGPDTVNPSLWRQAQLLSKAGLFKVVDGIYQVRSADLANMSIIEGEKSIIVVDPLTAVETARAALKLYYQHRPHKPVSTIIYTHSHADHYSGAKGIVSQNDIDRKRVTIIAPDGFAQAAIEENILMGNVMTRRASYMYGNLLEKGPGGQVSSGLGLTTSAGSTSLLLPTQLITKTGQEKNIDGVRFIFLMAPGSEAPAEMFFYLPQHKALCAAEDATHTLHNIYTLRGAKVRNTRAWVKYLQEAIDMFGKKAEAIFAQHHWPIWGNARVMTFLEKQRDMYKYLHDQTVRLANQGYTMLEIAEMVQLPKSLSDEWYNQGYYGSVNHNVKAIYNFYLGFFDGNPATLHPLPPTEAGKNYVSYMGGSQEILKKAQIDYNAGNYRWVAQVLNHVVAAEPYNEAAKNLLAQTFEQLGYQTDNGPWRNFYLSGAQELKYGIDKNAPTPKLINADTIAATPTDLLFDYLAVHLNGPRAAEYSFTFNITMPDIQQRYVIEINNGVLHYFPNKIDPEAKASVILSRSDFNDLFLAKTTIKDLRKAGTITIKGNEKIFPLFFSLLDTFNFWFPIV